MRPFNLKELESQSQCGLTNNRLIINGMAQGNQYLHVNHMEKVKGRWKLKSQ